jgi:8-oxo-dGTP pyrophosphatase MutT (NUDIX family)
MDSIKLLRRALGPELLVSAGTAVVVCNAAGEYLLQKQWDRCWSVPGGVIELGESAEEAGQREVAEQTGLLTADYRLVGIFSGQVLPVPLPNADECCPVTFAYTAMEIGSVWRGGGAEPVEARFFPAHRLPDGLNPCLRTLLLRQVNRI